MHFFFIADNLARRHRRLISRQGNNGQAAQWQDGGFHQAAEDGGVERDADQWQREIQHNYAQALDEQHAAGTLCDNHPCISIMTPVLHS